MRVMRPLRLSERTEVNTSVDPFSEGASRAAHSSRPALSDCSVSRSWTSSHSSSRACDAACSWARRSSSMGGHIAVDMTAVGFQGRTQHPPAHTQKTDAAKQQGRIPSWSATQARWAGAESTQQISLLSAQGPHPCPGSDPPCCSRAQPSNTPASSANYYTLYCRCAYTQTAPSAVVLASEPWTLFPCCVPRDDAKRVHSVVT